MAAALWDTQGHSPSSLVWSWQAISSSPRHTNSSQVKQHLHTIYCPFCFSACVSGCSFAPCFSFAVCCPEQKFPALPPPLLRISSSFLCSVALAPLPAPLAACASCCPLSSLFSCSCSAPSSILRTTVEVTFPGITQPSTGWWDEWRTWGCEESSGAPLEFVCLKSRMDSVGWDNGKPSVKADHFGGAKHVLGFCHSPLPLTLV